MGHSRARRLLCCFLLLSIIICSFAALSGNAQDYPNIADIYPTLYLTDSQQFFHRTGGYVLISTDSSSKTLASLLDSSGELDTACVQKPIVIKFAYQKVALYGDILYLVGNAAGKAHYVDIERINLCTGEYKMNVISSVDCDYSRGFNADANENLSLVTGPSGVVINPTTPVSHYLFDVQQDGIFLYPQPDEPASSSTASAVTSVLSSTVSASPSSEVASQPDSEPPLSPFPFDQQVTVESLQKELDANGLGQKLHVFSQDNIECKSGCIGTGQIIKTYLGDKLENQYTAVIPGDLDGTGTVTEKDLQILYTYFTKFPSSGSPILSGTFFEAAKISSDLKIDASRSTLLPSDLLKIKKLEK